MKPLLLIGLLLAVNGGPAFSQKASSRIFTCSYGRTNPGLAQCRVEQQNAMFDDNDAKAAVDKILKPLGLPFNFVLVPCPKIKNAKAVTLKDGIRYIIYDQYFMSRLDQGVTDWASTSILAHEIGHHLCGHTLQKSSGNAEQRIKEIQADDFSGFILCKLGASLQQAKATISAYESDAEDNNSDHPNRRDRLAAIEKGYNRARAQQPAANVDVSPGVETFYNDGVEAYRAGKYQQAMDKFTTAIELKPGYAYPYEYRGNAKRQLKDYDGAMVDFNKALQLKPDFDDAYNNRGLVKMAREDFTGAVVDFTTALELNPDNVYAYNNRGAAKAYLNNRSAALADMNKAIALKPDYANAYLNRGLLKRMMKDLDCACQDFRKSCRLGEAVGCDESTKTCQ